MANESKCLKCGALLTPDARDGVCPKCLLGQALAADSVEGVSGADQAPQPPRLTVRYFGDYELLEEIAHVQPGTAASGHRDCGGTALNRSGLFYAQPMKRWQID